MKSFLNLVQLFVILYIVFCSIYYSRKYSEIQNVYITSAIVERYPRNQLTLVVYMEKSDSLNFREIFLIQNKNSTNLYFENSPFSSSTEILTWTGEIDINEDLRITAEHQKTNLLEEHYGRPDIKIIPTEAYSDSHEVVTCASSIPRNADFPTILTAITSAIAMGSFVNIPYHEMPGELFKLLQTFENKNHLRLSPHPLTRKNIDNPHLMSELVQLHCMLMYRSKSKFIIFQPIDKIVLPIAEIDYFNEFGTIFLQKSSQNLLEYNGRVVAGDGYRDEVSSFQPEEQLHHTKMVLRNKWKTKILVMKTPLNMDSIPLKIAPMYSIKLNETQFSDSTISKIQKTFIDLTAGSIQFTILSRNCKPSQYTEIGWRCESKKCIRPVLRHGSLHGMYSYNIHQSYFIKNHYFHCNKH